MSLRVDIVKHFPSFSLDVSFECESGETLGFLGASGCGKSLTMRCIAGVETPDEGLISINGTTVFDSSAKIDLSAQQRKTALLFQNYQLFPNLSVSDNIAAGLARSVEKQERKRIVTEQLERFGLESFARRYPLSLSGGQQQRVALARMLVAKPGILMLDEPFSALDSHLKDQLEQDLLDLFEEYSGSILYVSHDIDEAFRFCDTIAVLDAGQIVAKDETGKIFRDPDSLAAIKLSGCRNISRATKTDSGTISALDWGIELSSSKPIPDGLKHVGIRASYLRLAQGENHNVIKMYVQRVLETRFEYLVILNPAHASADEARFQWRLKKEKNASQPPFERGETIDVYLDDSDLYLVDK
ncbi:MAG: sulfate/molybdate ABC transporter ATP-binding protein [Raoultibacter sp.]|jgi:molybdate transport system ATP-binding protein